MQAITRTLLLALTLATTACTTLSPAKRDAAAHIAVEARSTEVLCARADACAAPSPLRDLGTQAVARSTSAAPQHYALLLEYGQDALLARLDLIRGAQRTIDVQTYIFDEDDAGHLVLEELLSAARRGVQVRLLVDQLSAMRTVDTLSALAGAHTNFEMRIYNPVLGRARISYPQYALAAACCWRRLNQRMHSKALLIDGVVGITGGRNYQDDYFDWSDTFNFRDRDVLIAGPVVEAMEENFVAFWHAPLSTPVEQLADVGRQLLRSGVPPVSFQDYERPDRVAAILEDAGDAVLVRQRLVDAALPVGPVEFIGDLPSKHRRNQEAAEAASASTPRLRELIESAQDEVLLQTPYLVLSKPAEQMFSDLRARAVPPQVVVSTNSLAATDSFITYALSYKYKRRHLRDFGFQIYEYKPFPEDAPIDLEVTGAVGISWNADGSVNLDESGSEGVARTREEAIASRPASAPPLTREYSALRYAGIGVNRRVPLNRTGLRMGLHAKSLVIDARIGVVGTHNFDPRGDNLNTESAVVIDDGRFAQRLAESIRRDMSPENSWTIARRDPPPVFSGVDYSMAKVSERLPIFDLWPTRYATSFEFQPGPDCPAPLPPDAPGFRECYVAVGDFPEVSLGFRSLLTRIFTAFGAGLVPIL
ncbi:phospholipase D family protein [Luteimonas sp. 3794]|uniref:phospholipase D family protein n=1 Tax=Luteimonas sp. 3794 TaxID=2817730 RepID=UPI00285F329A|nr:phospholipase D family protein [Luteimonas sp. 3794]MDR6990008.1 phosphatidylserine/phosphatidylglycerophosphate/cardiolipin synthase-like enzyme [Luteimonas sp. 3794]